MGKANLSIEVPIEDNPATCDVQIIAQGYTTAGRREPMLWDSASRQAADRVARAVLTPGTDPIEVQEAGVHRRYRVPSRVKDGWSVVKT